MNTAKEWAVTQAFGAPFMALVQEHRREWHRVKDYGFEIIADLETCRGVDGFIASSKERNTSIICFRGTEVTSDFIDVWTDAEFALVHFERGGDVHKGFYETYNSVREKIESFKPRLEKHVYIFGHSLGGAMTQLCHILSFHDHENCQSVSYAGPKIGNRLFWNSIHCQMNMLKIVWDLDIVPRVPPGLIGCCEPIPNNNFWIRDIKRDSKRKQRVNWRENFDIWSLGYNISDHMVPNYTSMAEEILKHYRD